MNDNDQADILRAAKEIARLLEFDGYRHVTIALEPHGGTNIIFSRKFGGENGQGPQG